MYSEAAYQDVQTWIKGLKKELNHAYTLRYDQPKGNGVEHFFLIYVPGAGEQISSGIGQSGSIFGDVLQLNIQFTGNDDGLFNIVSYTDRVPKLKIKLDGKSIPCDVTVVDFNPTVFAPVPGFDIK